MRISDWSSDVCSSDLSAGAAASIDSAAVSPRLANLWRSCSMPLPPDSTIAVACCLHLLPLRAFTLRRDEALEVEAADHALELVDAFGLSFGDGQIGRAHV